MNKTSSRKPITMLRKKEKKWKSNIKNLLTSALGCLSYAPWTDSWHWI